MFSKHQILKNPTPLFLPKNIEFYSVAVIHPLLEARFYYPKKSSVPMGKVEKNCRATQ